VPLACAAPDPNRAGAVLPPLDDRALQPPPNKTLKLSRPGFVPAAEPPRASSMLSADTPVAMLLGGLNNLGSNRRAAAASARGPWPRSLASRALGARKKRLSRPHRRRNQRQPTVHSLSCRISDLRRVPLRPAHRRNASRQRATLGTNVTPPRCGFAHVMTRLRTRRAHRKGVFSCSWHPLVSATTSAVGQDA
jgi:hypothetical protein